MQLGNQPLEPFDLLLLRFKVLEIAVGILYQLLVISLQSLNLLKLISQLLLHRIHLRLVLLKDRLGVAEEKAVWAVII